MAARTVRLFQDQNLNAHINGIGLVLFGSSLFHHNLLVFSISRLILDAGAGAGTVSGKADFMGQRKGRAGGRKPLGDLSNAGKPINQAGGKKALDGSLNLGKPSVTQPSKQLKSNNLTVIMNDEAVSAKAKNLESSRITANKASEKSRTGSRKALSDISNSGKPRVPEIKNKNSLKPLREEPLHPSAIAEEQFLHNHQECIKSQFGAVDVHHFLKTVGLENGN